MDRERDIPAFALECCMAFRNRDGTLSWLLLSDVVVGVLIEGGLLVIVVVDDDNDGVAVVKDDDDDVVDDNETGEDFSALSFPHERSLLTWGTFATYGFMAWMNVEGRTRITGLNSLIGE